jgi:hypothetical protein
MGALGIEDEFFDRSPARTAMLLGPVIGIPAALVEDGMPFA